MRDSQTPARRPRRAASRGVVAGPEGGCHAWAGRGGRLRRLVRRSEVQIAMIVLDTHIWVWWVHVASITSTQRLKDATL
jgi:hypothetical protein